MTEATLAEYPKTVVLKDGAHLVLRPMTAAERSAVAALAPVPAEEGPAPLDAADAVVLAWDGERVAGATVLRRTAGDTAAVSVTLAPAYRGRRLGTWMLLDGIHLAAGLGFARLEAVARGDDEGHLAALHRLDFVEQRDRSSAARLVLAKVLHAGWPDF